LLTRHLAGAPTKSRLDRAVVARYFFFMIISNMVVFSLLGVFYTAIAAVVVQIGQHQSASTILNGLKDIPNGKRTAGRLGLADSCRDPRDLCPAEHL
jgi:hypothetical protein